MLLERTSAASLKNQNGISILELMLSVFVTGAIIVVFTQGVSFFYATTNTVKKNELIDATMIKVSEAFGTQDKYCNYNLATFTGNPNPNPNLTLSMAFPAGSPVKSIAYHDEKGLTLAKVVEVNKMVDKDSDLTVKSITLKPVADLDAQNMVANLEVIFERKNALGPSSIERRLPLSITKNPVTGYIESCSASSNTTAFLEQRLCEIRADGFAHYDVTKKACVDNTGVQWYDGATPYEATCPDGFKPAVSEILTIDPSLFACSAAGPDPLTLPPRTYVSGYVSNEADLQAWAAAVDLKTRKCTFVYIVGSDPAKFKSKVKCTKM